MTRAALILCLVLLAACDQKSPDNPIHGKALSDNEIKDQTDKCHAYGFQAAYGQDHGFKVSTMCLVPAEDLASRIKPTDKCFRISDKYDPKYKMIESPCNAKEDLK